MRACRLTLAAAFMLILVVPAGAAVGPFDPGFGRGGKLGIGLGEGPTLAAMAPDPAGGFVLTGSANPAAGEYALIRIGDTGRVDTSFGNWKPDSNRFFPPAPAVDYHPAALAARPGGGWVTAGRDASVFAVVAHRADGKVDTTFGSGGIARLDLGGDPASASALSVLPDGRFLVGGEVVRPTSQDHFVVARLNADGTPDASWGASGVAEIAPPDGVMCDEEYADFGVQALLPVSGGSTLVVGTVAHPASDRPVPALARLRSDGSIDPEFGSGGTQLLRPALGSGSVVGAVPRGNGGATLGLTLGDHCDNPTLTHFGAMAVRANGALDESYGIGGTATVGFPSDVRARAITRLPGGRIALVGGIGEFPPFIQREFAVARLMPKGRLDPEFGGGRTCSEVSGGETDGPATAVLPLSGRRLLVGGATQSDAGSLELIRYRGAFPPGGVECFWPEQPGSGRLRYVQLRAILGRRGRLRLLVGGNRFGSRARFRPVCLGPAGPGNILALWDGRVNGRSLKPGSYITVLELRDARGRLLGRSYPRAIGLSRRASGPRRSC